MARKKKNKIIVELDLPKNDSTMMKLYVILMITGFLGLSSFGFWITNSHFTTSPNGQPLFVNLACGFDSSVELTPALNETCPMLEDEATPIVYEI